MISYGKQTIERDDIEEVIKILEGDWLTQGPKVDGFEQDLKTRFGTEHCCAVVNGTAALHLAGMALRWQPGDVIITSPLTFLASANCVVYSGATPDFVDIDPDTYTIDVNKLEDKISSYRKQGIRIKAVIAVDFAGHPCDWKALKTLADKYQFRLVNDNCHALGAEYLGDDQYAGKYADLVVQSYHPVKHITTGEGGAALTNDCQLDEKIRILRTHGITKDPHQLLKNDGSWYHEMHEIGFNYRITDMQCALGSNQLKKLDRFVSKRRQIAAHYNDGFGGDDRYVTPAVSKGTNHAYHLYPLQIKFDSLGISKKQMFAELNTRGINPQVHYIPIHLQPYYKKAYGFRSGDFPHAEAFYHNEVSIPIFPLLSESEVDFIIEQIHEVLSKLGQ